VARLGGDEFVLPVSTTSHDLKLALDLERLPEHVPALLRHQLHTLLTRLSILQGRQQTQEPLVSPASQRFRRFQQLVDERFAQWHHVADYASQLG
jgi:GGDEF domain-containing protein